MLPTSGGSWQELSYWRTFTGRIDLAPTVLASFDHDASILTRKDRYGDGDLPINLIPE
ncbi:hypothetical protein [Micromonospora sp. NPDC003241]